MTRRRPVGRGLQFSELIGKHRGVRAVVDFSGRVPTVGPGGAQLEVDPGHVAPVNGLLYEDEGVRTHSQAPSKAAAACYAESTLDSTTTSFSR